MHHLDSHHRPGRFRAALGALAATVALGLVATPGCQQEKPKENKFAKISYTDLGEKPNVPAFMKGTIWELTDRTNDEPYNSATYGLVGRLRDTGDATASLPVRQWMIKEMARHGYGDKLLPGYRNLGADQVLRDPSYAIVRVDGLIPPGARSGDFFDVKVTALPGNKTSSLSGGLLFESDLHKLRGNSPDLEGIDILAKARGPIIVNPAYALGAAAGENVAGGGQAKASLRTGVIMDGGRVTADRPLLLRLRHPGYPMARAIENRINQRFQKVADRARKNVMPISYQVAAALDQGLVEIYVPRSYRGDWQHFMGVVEQLYVNSSPGNLVAKAEELTDEAVKPDAPLLEISYALEGIGEAALQFTLPLMAHASPDVAFAMARASVFIGDESGAAQDTLLRIARNDQHPFQIPAVQTLGALPGSPERNQKLRTVLESKNTLARIETYKVLVRNNDSSIYTRWISDPRDGRKEGERDEKFALDVVPAGGEPVIFASRSGIPRIALIGPKPQLVLPCLFTTMDNRLMISSDNASRNVTIFFRDEARNNPLRMLSRPDIAELAARLGGDGAPAEERFDFTYGEVVAILQGLADQRKVSAASPDGQVTLAPFVFEQPRDSQDLIDSAPVIEDSRPNTADPAAMIPGTEDSSSSSVVAQK